MAALICAAMVSGVSLGAGASWHDLTRGNDAAYGFQAYAGPHIATHFAIVAAFQGLLTHMEEDDPRFTLVWSRYLALLAVGLQVGGLAYSAVASIRPWRFLTFDLTATRWAIQVEPSRDTGMTTLVAGVGASF